MGRSTVNSDLIFRREQVRDYNLTMRILTRSAQTKYAAQTVFDVVADIESYPSFVPWCSKAIIHSQDGNIIVASLRIAKGPFSLNFTTRNTMIRAERIDISLVDGPFRHFSGMWSFESLNIGCLVSLRLEFELANKTVGRTITPFLEELTKTMVQAFCSRADSLHSDFK